MNPHHPAYRVACPYCGAARRHPCRHTMLPGRPVIAEPHPTRTAYATTDQEDD